MYSMCWGQHTRRKQRWNETGMLCPTLNLGKGLATSHHICASLLVTMTISATSNTCTTRIHFNVELGALTSEQFMQQVKELTKQYESLTEVNFENGKLEIVAHHEPDKFQEKTVSAMVETETAKVGNGLKVSIDNITKVA
eukprot:Blabericola_migrator_1__8790@NODE_4635_length_1049_cov_7502_642566_g2882_i0_p1_GENE_NODE_4635_length_1049_cov_7502_642566_g2882_i0NODE_4635_length_1049_cov_7502_642566_g2882_i0_p1_ORF_typecomplete_len140_score28_14DUF3137/PF11335_8/0_029Adeno_shaft/PF00608_17/12Adeno_shaft/PF00608_17/5_8e03Adeno_shaft/PF00608_17/19_NODE_4635_length_1049_cov_7502_642566_g2882_i0550969